MKKKYLAFALIPVFALALLAGGLTYASASTTDTTKHNPFEKLAAAIADKFSLDEDDVQAVIDETMEANKPDESNKPADRVDPITQAVTDGKLTQDQADLITAKREAMKTEMESNKDTMKDMTDTERKTAMEEQQTELKQWAEDNDIPEEYVMFLGGRGGHGGPGMGGQMGQPPMNGDKTTTSETASE